MIRRILGKLLNNLSGEEEYKRIEKEDELGYFNEEANEITECVEDTGMDARRSGGDCREDIILHIIRYRMMGREKEGGGE